MSFSAAPSTRLLPRQTRVIHAQGGVRLRVVSGRLWLTQPNAAQDLFLGPGDVVDLLQDWVVIGADVQPDRRSAGGNDTYSEFQVQPMVVPAPASPGPQLGWGPILRRLRRVAIPWLGGRRRMAAR
jgi:hypothetical protein